MLKSSFWRTGVAVPLAAGLGAALVGCATTPQKAAPVAYTQPIDCVHDTGTHIRLPEHACVGTPGSTYTKDDLDRTGQTNVAAALRQLDPRMH